MLELRHPRRWQTASGLLLVFVLVGGLLPELIPGSLSGGIPHMDKWLHGVTFAGLAAWFCGLYGRHRYPLIAAGLFSYGALIEVIQALTTYRTASLYDLAADAAGIACGIGFALAGGGGWGPRAERWLRRRAQEG